MNMNFLFLFIFFSLYPIPFHLFLVVRPFRYFSLFANRTGGSVRIWLSANQTHEKPPHPMLHREGGWGLFPFMTCKRGRT